jgi:hypothetical protein
MLTGLVTVASAVFSSFPGAALAAVACEWMCSIARATFAAVAEAAFAAVAVGHSILNE